MFVTGASGFIGSAVVRELLDSGHQVLGLARSDAAASASAVSAAGAEVHRGSLDDLDSLRAGAAAAGGVIHTAYNHESSDLTHLVVVVPKTDRVAIEAMCEALAGTDRPFVMTSGSSLLAGQVTTEDSRPGPDSPGMARFANEELAVSFVERGVRASAVRFPLTVHGEGDHGFVALLINLARTRGVSAYVGDGTNRWAAVHRLDGAHLFRLAVEKAPAGARLHGVGEDAVPFRDIAEAIGRNLGLPTTSVSPEAAQDHFGHLAPIAALDVPASSVATRQLVDWQPVRPTLIADLDKGHYFDERS